MAKTKPLWRWTVGGCTQQGLDILAESVFRTTRALGEDAWDWMICHNSLTRDGQESLREIVQGRPIAIHEQSWDDCPIDDAAASPVRADNTVEVDGALCGGTLWKVCPARMRPDAHEVVMDNDLVLLRKPPQVDQFLSSGVTLILEEPVRYYGRFEAVMPLDERLNSGLMGFPPGFDFAARIRSAWEENGRVRGVTQADEQGLLMFVMRSHPSVRIPKEEVRELLAGDPPRVVGDECGCHFVQANRTTNHRSWLRYQEVLKESVPFL